MYWLFDIQNAFMKLMKMQLGSLENILISSPDLDRLFLGNTHQDTNFIDQYKKKKKKKKTLSIKNFYIMSISKNDLKFLI